jgi:Putative zinc-finger
MKDESKSMRSDGTHERCWQLLPWLVNGTLPADQVESVERHISECPQCASEVRAHRALQEQMRDGDAVLMAPQGSWQKMAERLDDEADEVAIRQSARTSRPVRRQTRATNMLPWAVAAQALIIVGLATTLWLQQPRFITLTSVTDAPIGPGTVRVVFRRDIALAEVNALLRGLPAQIVTGPTEAGVFTLATPKTDDLTRNATTQLLSRLRDDSRVIFAEPALDQAVRSTVTTQKE